jgi:putative adhesin
MTTTTKMKRAVLLLGPSLLLLAGCNLGPWSEGSFHRDLPVSGNVDLQLEAGAGRITVHSGDVQRVSIDAHIRARGSWGFSGEQKVREIENNPPIEQRGNSIRIGRIEDHNLGQHVRIDYDLIVPPQTQLKTTTGAGNQRIQGIQLAVTARSGAGTISVEQCTGDARLETGAGRIDVRDQEGALDVGTGAGSVEVRGTPKHDWRVRVGAGGIHLKVPRASSFDLDARSGFGAVSIASGLKVGGSISSRRVQGKVGNGGPTVDLSSGAGSINIDD